MSTMAWDLVLHILGHVAADHHADVLGRILDYEFGQLQALFLIEEEHLAGLADGEDAGDALFVIPFDDLFHSRIVDPVVGGEGGDHDGPDAVGDRLHNATPLNFFIHRLSGFP